MATASGPSMVRRRLPKWQRQAGLARKARVARTEEASGPPTPSIEVDKLIAALPRQRLLDTVQVWRNACGKLNDPKEKRYHGAARRVLTALEQEWARRSSESPNPEDYFRWPSTEAAGGDGSLTGTGWLPQGLLGLMDYRVGRNSDLLQRQREAILYYVDKFRFAWPSAIL